MVLANLSLALRRLKIVLLPNSVIGTEERFRLSQMSNPVIIPPGKFGIVNQTREAI